MTSSARRPGPEPASGARVRPRETARGREEMRHRILRASLELFARDGFEQTTVRTIARRCGVTDALLYYYYPSKRHILSALWDTPQSPVLHEVDPGRPLTLPRLMQLVDQMVSASAEMDAIIRLMVRRALSGDADARAFRQRTADAWRRDVHAHFATVLSAADADLNTDLLTSIVFGATFPAQAAHGPLYPALARTEEFRRLVRELLLDALPFCREQAER